jgi:cobalt-zinc-cadmium efflux system membrane fusion protein
MKKMTSYGLILGAGFLLLLLPGCGGEPAGEKSGPDIPPPPSIAGEQRTAAQTIQLEEGQAADLEIRTTVAQLRRFTYPIVAPGTVFPAPDNISLVSAPIEGRVSSIYAHEGEPVRKGQVLLELESLEFSNLLADVIQARADLQYQKSQLERVRQLVEKKISTRSNLERVQANHDRAEAANRAALSRIMALGVTEKEVLEMKEARTLNPHLKIRAPIKGAIAKHLIDLGQSVSAYEELLTIVNLEKVKVEGYVSPGEGSMIQPGDSAVISLKEYPERSIISEVSSINPALDERNRSITVYVIAPTQKGWPKPGENVRLKVFVTTPVPVVAVPSSAIVYEENIPVVFVRKGALLFEKRPVSIARDVEGMTVLRSGIQEGEEVAISQLFTLKALSRFEQFAE